MKKKLIFTFTSVLIAFFAYFWMMQVDNSITQEDRRAISRALPPYLHRESFDAMAFEEEIEFIKAVQASVLGEVPINAGIPHGMPREPSDLLVRGKGLCFDRSRFIEKALRQHGFETRHIAIYSTAETGSSLVSLLTPQVRSHAVTEVLTSRGWMVVDSNEPWISIGKGYQPLSVAEVSDLGKDGMEQELVAQPDTAIYEEGFTYVYGLYSRHGQFYPPYDMVPDVNVSEFSQNVSRAFM